ncbi:hypothetical protein QUC31_011682 [Theobroma cacao]
MWMRPISQAVSPQTLQQCPITLILHPPRKNYKTPKERRTAMEAAGSDSDGREFKNPQEMWRKQIGDADEGDNHKKTQWYREGVAYWEGVEASVDGVLGGFGQVNEADIKGSEVFLNTLLHERFSMAVEEITILLLLVLLFLSLCAQLYIVFTKLYTHICSVEVVWFMLL